MTPETLRALYRVSSTPVPGDSDYVLVFRIVSGLSQSQGGIHKPLSGDSFNRLLFKWAALVAT